MFTSLCLSVKKRYSVADLVGINNFRFFDHAYANYINPNLVHQFSRKLQQRMFIY